MENQPTTPPENNLVWAQGNFEAAQKAADDAKKFSIWGAAIALISVVAYLLFFVLLGIGGAFAGY